MSSPRGAAWAWFDHIVAVAPRRDEVPWRREDSGVRFEPDYDTLRQLLAVPALLKANSQSGVPALALDVWVSYELRRAGFDADRVWPRPVPPRVISPDVLAFVSALPASQREAATERINRFGTGGASAASILGKNYVKQVDVVLSSWATGPELLISTKRMDSSFGKNAANRVEESYGDAKNLRSRHPEAALGFLYGLGASALEAEAEIARWLIDLLGKLGRESDAYDAVGLVIPQVTPVMKAATEVELASLDLALLPPVTLVGGAVPGELEPCLLYTSPSPRD